MSLPRQGIGEGFTAPETSSWLSWERWESCLRYFNGKERCRRDCLTGKKKKRNTWVKNFQTFCFTLLGSLTYVVLTLVKLLFARWSLMLLNTQLASPKGLQINATIPPPIPIHLRLRLCDFSVVSKATYISQVSEYDIYGYFRSL